MADLLRLRVVTPRGTIFEGPVASVAAESETGAFGFLPGHQPMVAALKAGEIVAERSGASRLVITTTGGFFEGGADHVSVLAPTAEIVG